MAVQTELLVALQRVLATATARKLLRGSAWSFVGAAGSRILILASMIVLARVLGPSSFGEFGTVQAMLGVAGTMAGFGLGSTATRFVAQYWRTEPDRASPVVALVYRTSAVLVAVTALSIALASNWIAAHILNAAHLQSAVCLGTLLLVGTAMRGVQTGVLAGVERFDVAAKLNLLEGAVSLPLVAVLGTAFGVGGGLLGLTLGTLIAWLAGQYLVRHTLHQLGISLSHPAWWSERHILFRFSTPSYLASLIASPVLWYCTLLIAAQPQGYREVALYHAAYQWHGPLMFLPMILLSVSSPVMVQHWAANRSADFGRLFKVNGLFVLAASLAPAVLVAAASTWIMGLYGSGFEQGTAVLSLLALAAPFHAMAKTAATALLGMDKAWDLLYSSSVWGLVMVTSSLLLTSSHGVLGLAISFTCAYAAESALSLLLVRYHLRASRRVPTALPDPGVPG